jgi:hypothetical protein
MKNADPEKITIKSEIFDEILDILFQSNQLLGDKNLH